MHRRLHRVSAISLGLAFTGVWLGAQAPSRTTNDGVYTSGQAERGRATFTARCTACHQASSFKGNEFVSGWANQPLGNLFEVLSATMPGDNPGSLTPQEYADIVALMLQLNGVRPGSAELKGEKGSMAAIRFEPPAP